MEVGINIVPGYKVPEAPLTRSARKIAPLMMGVFSFFGGYTATQVGYETFVNSPYDRSDADSCLVAVGSDGRAPVDVPMHNIPAACQPFERIFNGGTTTVALEVPDQSEFYLRLESARLNESEETKKAWIARAVGTVAGAAGFVWARNRMRRGEQTNTGFPQHQYYSDQPAPQPYYQNYQPPYSPQPEQPWAAPQA